MFPGPGERGRSIKDWAKIILPWQYYCYKSVQSFRVDYLFTGQFNTKGYGHGTITDVIQLEDQRVAPPI